MKASRVCRAQRNSYSSEKGSALVLISVSILGVIIFATIFAFDNVTSHKANLLAQHTADKAIFYAKDLFLVTSGYSALQTAVNTLPADGKLIDEDARFKITKVIAVFPAISNTLPPQVKGDDLHGGSARMSFADFNTAFNTNLICPATVNDADCLVYLDVESTVPQGLVPAGFWDRDQHGMHFGMAIQVASDTVFLKIDGITSVTGKGKAFLSISHRNKIALEDVPNSSGRPSYILGIAPQAMTLPLENSSFSYPANYSSTLNPASSSQTYSGFEKSSPPAGSNPLDVNKIFRGSFSRPEQPMYPLDAPATPDFRQALISGCFAPWIAARNLFIQLLVEEMSRLGSLRDTFQFGIVHSFGDDGSPTRPTIVKLPGEDPFPNSASNPTNGMILPFVNRRKANGELRCNFKDGDGCIPEDGWYIEQFRSCFHANSTTNGVESATPYFQFSDVSNRGMSYEPAHYQSKSTAHQLVPSSIPYGQYGNDGISKTLGLSQVVRFMGVEQRCVQHKSGGAGNCERPADPSKLLNPNDNVIPDITSFLRYASAQDTGYEKAGPLQYKESNPTATFKTVQIENQDIRPLGLGYHPADVILILNQRLPSTIGAPSHIQSYRGNIQREVTRLNQQGRRVIVIFFARGPEDEGTFLGPGNVIDDVFQDLQETFCVNFTGGQCMTTPPVDFLGNAVVRIAPAQITSSPPYPQYVSSECPRRPPVQFGSYSYPAEYNTDQCFQNFYLDLLTRDEPRSIEEEVRGIMNSLLFDLRVSL